MTMKDQLQWWLIILLFFSSTIAVFPQNMAPGTPVLEEYGRREQLLSNSLDSLKPQGFRPDLSIKALFAKPEENTQKVYGFSVLPVQSKIQYNSKRPYGYGGYGMHNGRGYEQYLSAGLYGYLGFLHLQLQPEFVYSQNKSYQGFSSDFPIEVLLDRFHFWNRY